MSLWEWVCGVCSRKGGMAMDLKRGFEMSPYHQNCQHLSSQISTPPPLFGRIPGRLRCPSWKLVKFFHYGSWDQCLISCFVAIAVASVTLAGSLGASLDASDLAWLAGLIPTGIGLSRSDGYTVLHLAHPHVVLLLFAVWQWQGREALLLLFFLNQGLETFISFAEWPPAVSLNAP